MNIDNLFNKDIKSIIEKSINMTKDELKGLSTDTMCMVYSSYLYNNLKKHNIPCHIIDTNDLNIDYEHRFILVPNSNNYYLIDLTFSQFKKDVLPNLIKNGYDLMDEDKWKIYLNVVSKVSDKTINIDDAYYKM